MYGPERDQLVGVPGYHGFGAVRVPQQLGDTAPKPTNVKVGGAKLPTTKAKPPTFKGTRDGQVGLPGDDPAVAFLWSAAKQTWTVITRAEGLKRMKAAGVKATPAKPANPFADVSSGSSSTAAKKPAPGRMPLVKGTVFGQTAVPNDVTQHAWLWDGKKWIGISREQAKDKWGTISKLGLKDLSGAKVPTGTSVPKVAPPPAAPTRPGAYNGEVFLPSNKAEHAWRWNADLKQWQGISRSDAIKPVSAATSAAAKEAATEADRGLLDKLTGGAVTYWKDALTPKAPAPAPDVVTIATDQSGVPAGWVRMSNGKLVRQPTAADPDADGQKANGVPAPPPTPGVPGTYPKTAQDPNGDGYTRPGVPAQPPTVGVPGTFPATARDPNGDGIDDVTGKNAVAPVLGQKGSFPPTPDDLDGDGLNDKTGKPLNAGPNMSELLVPIAAGAAILLFVMGGHQQGGHTRSWR